MFITTDKVHRLLVVCVVPQRTYLPCHVSAWFNPTVRGTGFDFHERREVVQVLSGSIRILDSDEYLLFCINTATSL